MKPPDTGEIQHYFNHDANVGIIGRGETIEICFADAAKLMFALMTDVSKIHFIQIITFEFEEDNTEDALITWLNLLLDKAKSHHLIFGDFRLKREGNIWKATVSGQKNDTVNDRVMDVKGAIPDELSVMKINYGWEVRCVVTV